MAQQVGASNKLIQISKDRPALKRAGFVDQLFNGPAVDKFFFVAVVGVIFGVAVFGVHLWLIRAGVMSAGYNYQQMRLLHVALQLFIFFGCFALGFVVQAAPKLVGSKNKDMPPLSLLPLVLLPIGVGAFCSSEYSMLGKVLISTAFLVPVGIVVKLMRSGKRERITGIGFPLILGLIGLSISPWFNVLSPAGALVFVWAGMFPLIFAAGQQFGAGFLGGRILTRFSTFLLIAVHIASSGVLILSATSSAPPFYWKVFSLLSLLSIVFFFSQAGLLAVFKKLPGDPFELGFGVACIWALAAPILTLSNLTWSDQLLHLWASGTGMTLIFVVSNRILGFLSGQPVLNGRIMLAIVLCWQLVPFLRGIGRIEDPLTAWVGTVVAGVCVTTWGIAVLRVVIRMNIRQFTMPRGEKMVQC